MQDERRNQTNQVFNMVENPIMTYIAEFLDELPNVIFKEDIPQFTEPFILLPWGDYKKDICIKFTLKPVDSVNPCKAELDKLICHDKIKEAIGFLVYCVNIVYPSVIASCMINNQPLVNTKLELDENMWMFRPVFLHELSHKKIFLQDTLTKLFEIKNNKDQFPPEMVNEVNVEIANVLKLTSDVNAQLTQDILDIEEEINESYENKPKLGIFIEEIHTSSLPKNINMDNISMPSISNVNYCDPDYTLPASQV